MNGQCKIVWVLTVIYFLKGTGRLHNKVFWHLYVCRNTDGSWNSNAKTFRSSNDCSNINDCVNHSAHKERLKNPVFMERTQPIWAPQKYICGWCSLPGSSELVPWLTEELSERNMFHHSFPSCLGQCTRQSVTWCNVRAMRRLALGGGCASVWHSAVSMCATEPWLLHY